MKNFGHNLIYGITNILVPIEYDSIVGNYITSTVILTAPIALLLLPSELFFKWIIAQENLANSRPPILTCFTKEFSDFNISNGQSCIDGPPRICDVNEDSNYLLRICLISIASFSYLGIYFAFLIRNIFKAETRGMQNENTL